MIEYPQPASFNEYDEFAASTDRGSGGFKVEFALQGLFGETGSILSEVKKHQRDAISFEAHRSVVLEEVGDALWYLSSAARRAGVALIEVVAGLPVDRLIRPPTDGDLAFELLDATDLVARYEAGVPYGDELRLLARHVGFMFSSIDAQTDVWDFKAHLAAVLNALIGVSHRSGIPIAEAATFNLRKILSRWPTEEFRQFDIEFDQDYPVYERLPRHLSVEIVQREKLDGSKFVLQRCNGLNLGNRLTDNIVEPDYYRFHDVFHYAFAAVLHWSPVLRALLKVKRKSDAVIDEAEDGARAGIIEEGLSVFIFSLAKQQDYFAAMTEGNLSYDLLKSVQNFVRGFEVAVCPPWLWERAILQGYAAFRFLQEHTSAVIEMDLDARSLRFHAVDEEAAT